MKVCLTVSIALVALLLLSAVVLAQSGDGTNPPVQYAIEAKTTFGGGYRLAGFSWQPGGIAGGGGYHLIGPASPTLRGNGCCCTYLPCVLRNN